MRYYDRICAVDFSNGIRIDELRIYFEVQKSYISERNYCRIDIYNLKAETRNAITKDKNLLVKLSAGYKENVGLVEIGQGNITRVETNHKSPDVITTVYVKDGFSVIRNNNISISFGTGTKLSSIIDYIVNNLQIPVKFENYNKNAELKTGFAFVGSIRTVLDNLAYMFGFNWSIQNGQLLLLENGNNTGRQIVYLSSSTGLIEQPEFILKTKSLEFALRNDYKIISLLQPQIEAGDLIEIESKNFKGVYEIKELSHKGDTRGKYFYTTIIVSEE